jgi:cytochrome c oxidase cbb3-type subunit 3
MLLSHKLLKYSVAGLVLACVSTPTFVYAGENSAAAQDNYQIARYILTGISALLLLVIAALGSAAAGAGKIYREREKAAQKNKNASGLASVLLLAAMALPQIAAAAESGRSFASTVGIPVDLYFFFFVVALEIAIIMVLVRIILKLLVVKDKTVAAAPKAKRSFSTWFRKINQTVAIEDEAQLDLQHDYDGIRELDNKVPAWWQYAFYATILFSVVYLYRMFGSETLPDQFTELERANAVAAAKKAEYLKNAANNVDENTVTMMDESGIAAGAILYSKNCLACHGDQGQGGVGPNLTDDYWLHKGGIKDIFYSIKYGWPEKGMKAWEADFSPAQIAQLSSYVKSLHGTNPPGAKEAQGELYNEEENTAEADTAAVSTASN